MLTKTEAKWWSGAYFDSVKYDQQECGVYYYKELVNIDGIRAWFFQTPDISDETVKRAISSLKNKDDVVKVTVLKFDYMPEESCQI